MGTMTFRCAWDYPGGSVTDASQGSVVYTLTEPTIGEALEGFQRFLHAAGYSLPKGDLDFVDDDTPEATS